jgi:hypothetical protein
MPPPKGAEQFFSAITGIARDLKHDKEEANELIDGVCEVRLAYITPNQTYLQ